MATGLCRSKGLRLRGSILALKNFGASRRVSVKKKGKVNFIEILFHLKL